MLCVLVLISLSEAFVLSPPPQPLRKSVLMHSMQSRRRDVMLKSVVCLFGGYSTVAQNVKIGPLSISPMGIGTWSWGNQLLVNDLG